MEKRPYANLTMDALQQARRQIGVLLSHVLMITALGLVACSTSETSVPDAALPTDIARYTALCTATREVYRTDPDSAWNLLKDAEVTALHIGGDSLRYDVEDLHFEVLRARNDPSAMEYLRSRMVDREKANAGVPLLVARMNLGMVLMQTGSITQADSILASAIPEALALKDTFNWAQALWLRMTTQNTMGFPDSAIAAGRIIVHLPPEGIARRVIERAAVDLAISYMNKGAMDSADLAFHRVIAEPWIQDDPAMFNMAVMNYGELKLLTADLSAALQLLLSARAKIEAASDTLSLSMVDLELGSLYRILFRFPEARNALATSVRNAARVGMADIEACSRGSLAIMELDLARTSRTNGPPQSGTELEQITGELEQALSVARTSGNERYQAVFQAALGQCSMLTGQTDRVRQLMDSAVVSARRRNDRVTLQEVLRRSADVADHAGRIGEARQDLTEALQISRDLDMKVDVIVVLDDLADLHRRTNDLKAALDAMQEAKTMQLQLFTDSNVNQLARVDARAVFEKQQFADSLDHIQRLALQKATADTRIQRQRTTTWAVSGIAALVMCGGAIGFVLDRRRRKAQYERDAARLEKDAAAFETQALRSQMNPHFIFNALNSISGYIQTNDPDQAQTFLARFAKLMRAVLENSRSTEVPLRKDLEVLRTYMELERIRTQNKFDFTITVDPALDPDTVLVPPLVAQPFVENAIWHGVAGISGQGHISLHVEQVHDQLLITVKDNGVGRDTQNTGTRMGRTSLSTAITRSRLDLVQKQKRRPAGFRYVDVLRGTCAEIHLPLEVVL